MINYILFALTCLSLIFLVLSFVYLFKQRILEDKRLSYGIDALLFGLLFLGLLLLVKHVDYANTIFALNLSFISSLSNIAHIVFVPLMAIFFLVSTLLFKEIK